MFESKYGKTLTITLIVVIVAIVGLLGFLAFDYFRQMFTTRDTSSFVDNFQAGDKIGEEKEPDDEETGFGELTNIESTPTGTASEGAAENTQKYKGFSVVGTMEIPSIGFKYPVLEKVTKKSIETSVAVLYPNGYNLNKPGNTVIIGHNYRNGLFFSNNKKINVGDKIYVTDWTGVSLTYTVYNKFETNDTDTSFYERDTVGKAELTLSTCTDANNDRRLIILAKQD